MKPHKVSAKEMSEFLADGWIEAAASNTVDETQRKQLRVAIGQDRWQVRRRYRAPGELWSVVHEGTMCECIDCYNGMG